MPNGTITRLTRREHAKSTLHRANEEKYLNLETASPGAYASRQREWYWKQRQGDPKKLRHNLLMAVTRAQIAAEHDGSMEAARAEWAREARERLGRIGDPALEAALVFAATAHVSKEQVAAAAERAHPVVRLILDVTDLL